MSTTSTRTWRGLTFGGGGAYQITEESGLDDLEVRSGIRDLPRAHGAAAGPHYAAPRTIVLDLWWAGGTAADGEGLTAALRAATVPSIDTLHPYGLTRPDGSEWFLRGRVNRRQIPRTVDTETLGLVRATLAFECPDPRIYSAASLGVTIVSYLLAPSGGFDLPADLPWNMSAATKTLGVVVNRGNADAYPVLRFTYPADDYGEGDCAGVAVLNLTTGQTLLILSELIAGQTLIADMDALVRVTGDPIVSIDGASRYGEWYPPRDPFALIPGLNLLRFAVLGDAPVVCRIEWRHTDL